MTIARRALQYIEIDFPYCANVYGTAPCTASIPATGAIKCFNTIKTCQDRAHYVEQGATIRFAVGVDYLPDNIEAFPSIESIDFTPQALSLGKDLGQRAVLRITFRDHPDTDTGVGFDKYLADRGYVPAKQGTFFGKLRARQPYLRGRKLRWINGFLGQAITEMETRNFIIDSFDGPNPAGVYSITASDVLKAADGDRAQAPKLSAGYLAADITSSATSASLLPSGIGSTYPASGYVCIGGNEVASFTRSGDALTIVRAQRGTDAKAHKAQDRVQLCLVYDGVAAADILRDLFVTYAGESSSYIDLTAWRAEGVAYLGNVYTTTITEPNAVDDLASELVEQAALATWWDDLNLVHRFQVLRAIDTTAARFTADDYLSSAKSTGLDITEQPDLRITRVQVYFGQVDPTKALTNTDNYRSSTIKINAQAEADSASVSLKTIYSRWIPQLGRTVADRLCDIILGRFSPDPPRHFTMQLMRYADTDAVLGGGYKLSHPTLQDVTGAQVDVPIQVTQLGVSASGFVVDAEEMLFNAPPLVPTVHPMVVDANQFNINLRTGHDSIYAAPQSGDTINVTINADVVVGSHSATLPAFDVGTWPAGVTINITLLGRIQGAGGQGGASTPGNGYPGGTAIFTRQAINLTYAAGKIWSGGGGGGGTVGYGGGGGAGTDPGLGGSYFADAPGSPGTPLAGGAGGSGSGLSGGAGGGPGLDGGPSTDGYHYPGGARGKAIDGISFVTIVGAAGDIRGPQVN